MRQVPEPELTWTGAEFAPGIRIAVAADGTAYVVGETNSTSGLPGTAGTVRTLAGGGGDGFVSKVTSTGSLSWLTLLAGTSASTSGIDRALAVAIDPADGNLLVAGETDSANFPANDGGTRQGQSGPQNAPSGNMDGFLVRMSPAGTSILSSTYLGGAHFDTAEGVAADGQGGIYVTGTTSTEASSTFPTLATNGLSTSRLGAQDGFLAKLVAGSPLSFAYSGFLGSNVGGGSIDDAMHALAAAPGVSSVLSIGGSTGASSSGFTGSTSGALGSAGATMNGVVLRIDPYRTPLTITAFSGTPQSATLGSGFAQVLAVRVADADGLGVAGFAVTFTPPPGTAASATLSPSLPVTTDGNGMAQVGAAANAIAGAYTVQATAAGVTGTAAFQLTNLKLAQSITFGPLAGKTVGDAPFTVSASASSSLPVTFSSTTLATCTVSGNSVTIVGAGGCTIAADQGGDATYAAASQVTQGFTVAMGSQTITFPTVPAQTFSVGGTFSVSATASSGLTVSFTSTTSAVCTVSGTTVTMGSLGTCTIAADQAGDANYNAAPQVKQDIAIQAVTSAHKPYDFNGDGKADIVWRNASDGSILQWLMNGTAVLQQVSLGAPGTTRQPKHVADFNGDGKADMIWQDADGSTSMTLMDGAAIVSDVTLVGPGTGWSVTQVADLNGDGKADLIWTNTDGSVQAWLMDGASATATAAFVPAGTGWSVLKTADLDGDGKADILWQHTSGAVQAWIMNGLAVTQFATFTSGGGGWTVALAGDLDGDGKQDLVWSNSNGAVQAWLMNGLAVTQVASFVPAGAGYTATNTADLNGDGKADILWRFTDGTVLAWIMGPGLTVSNVATFTGSGNQFAIARTEDLDGNGTDDILWAHPDGTVQAWLMNGLTVTGVAGFTGAGPYSIVPAAP
jgi:hypothetical protein